MILEHVGNRCVNWRETRTQNRIDVCEEERVTPKLGNLVAERAAGGEGALTKITVVCCGFRCAEAADMKPDHLTFLVVIFDLLTPRNNRCCF